MWLKQDKILNGFLISLVATLLTAFVILLLQKFLRIDVLANMKMYIFSCVSEILILRKYAKNQMSYALKGSVLSLILTLGAVFVLLLKYNYLQLQ